MTRRTREGVYVIESDRHFPYESKAYTSIILQVAMALGKDVVGWINLGDLLDNPQCSTHLNDPRRMGNLDEDVDSICRYLDDIESAIPSGATVDFLEGNHEKRLQNYTLRSAPAIVSLVSTFPKEYALAERNKRSLKWAWHPMEKWNGFQVADTVIHHGFFYDRNTAVTNLGRYCRYGVNFIQGHTHRVQYACNDVNFSATLGHGADWHAHNPTPDDHRMAFGILTVYKGKAHLEVVTVDEERAVVRGKVFHG